MTDNDPCQHEWDDFRQATEDLALAGSTSQQFIINLPISDEEIRVLSEQDFERMRAAYEREAAAWKNYLQKLQAVMNCRKQHKNPNARG